MKAVFETSVLVNAIVADLRGHERAAPLLRDAGTGDLDLYVSNHALAELYAALSSLPVTPRISPGQVIKLIESNVMDRSRTVTLAASDYKAVLRRMAGLGPTSGAIYDALHVRAAEKSGVDRLYTFNRRDFERMPPDPPVELIFL